MDKLAGIDWSQLVCKSPGLMVHPGLPPEWVVIVLLSITVITAIAWRNASASNNNNQTRDHFSLPIISAYLSGMVSGPWLLVTLRIMMAMIFILVIVAGLFGTPVAERNLATTLTWTLWWTGLIIGIFFTGSAWCAICPWDALASWLVRRRLWRRGSETSSLNLKAPKVLRNIWPALVMFIGLTWLELGVGVTTSPYATAVLALVVVVLATLSMLIYERKAFCRYFCSVGRTIGFYAELSPVALRPVDTQVCADCKTLECYHGTETVEPCPTHIVMGRINQNTYCTSCGACTQSCPEQNINWQWRRVGIEAMQTARPHWDEGWFILGLVALTSFHGVTMLPLWEKWISEFGQMIGDSGQLLWSFSIGMTIIMLIPIVIFMLLVKLSQRLNFRGVEFKRLFSSLAIATLPLAFTYHIAHNLTHLFRESRGMTDVMLNPLGIDTMPLSSTEMHFRHSQPLVTQDVIFGLQAVLIVFGFWMALKILGKRMQSMAEVKTSVSAHAQWPVFLFIAGMSVFNLWLLMQPMIMRMS